ncbi:MAG: class I tRNA ligase family protein, partial [Candidatus Babeliales bacterium]
KEYQERLAHFKPNTAISAFMEWLNDVHAHAMKLNLESIEIIASSLSIMAPHMASEILEQVVGKKLEDCHWTLYNPALTIKNVASIVVQVNGKVRAMLSVPTGTDESIVAEQAQKLISKWLADVKIVKVIFVQDRLINFVVKS